MAEESDAREFVTIVLRTLEYDFRRIALQILTEWDSISIATSDLFLPIAGLQRPSWGTWNWLSSSILNSRRTFLRQGSLSQRQSIERSVLLERLAQFFDQRVSDRIVTRLQPLITLTGMQLSASSRFLAVLSMPITLRNRIAHDNPIDAEWWHGAYQGLKQLLDLLLESKEYIALLDSIQLFDPWEVEIEEDRWLFNGLSDQLEVLYVNRSGNSYRTTDTKASITLCFQRLLGKANEQEENFRRLLTRLAPNELKGVLMGDYLVSKPVGEGAFGVVHVGRQLSTGRTVAIKILRDGLSDASKQRFHQEATFLSRLQHPGIVSIISLGEDPWVQPTTIDLSSEEWFITFAKGAKVRNYIAMEWIEGRNLDEIFRSATSAELTVNKITEWFLSAASALRSVHNAGLIHRDVKPSNIMISEEGQLKILDFGIARYDYDERTILTEEGIALGTPAYMSPEQIRLTNTKLEVGPQTDVYSLCATFYELYTKRRIYAHDTETADSIRLSKLKGDMPSRPRVFARSLPWELETILIGGLENDLNDRYRDMECLELDLRRFLDLQPIKYRRPSIAKRVSLLVRRNRRIAVITSTFGFLMTIGVATYIADIKNEKNRTQETLDVTRDALDRFFTRLSEEDLSKIQGLQPVRHQLLTDALEFYKRLLANHSDSRPLERSTAIAFANAGKIESMIGSSEIAISYLESAIRWWRSEFSQLPSDDEVAEVLATLLWDLAIIQNKSGSSELAIANMKDSIQLHERISKSNPRNSEAIRMLAISKATLAPLLRTNGQFAEAREKYVEALSLFSEFTSSFASWGFFVEAESNDSEQRLRISIVQRHSDAKKVGLKSGDFIRSVDGVEVSDADSFIRFAENRKAGDIVKIQYVRGQQTSEAKVTLMPLVDPMFAVILLNIGTLELEVFRDVDEAFEWFTKCEIELERLEDMQASEKIPIEENGLNLVENTRMRLTSSLSKIELFRGNVDQAITYLQQSLELVEKIAYANPSVIEHQERLMTDQANLGFMMLTINEAEGVGRLQQAYQIARELVDRDSEAIKIREKGSEIARRLADHFAQVGETEKSYNMYGGALFLLDHRWMDADDDSGIAFENAVIISNDPVDSRAVSSERKLASIALNNLGTTFLENDEVELSLKAFCAVKDLHKKLTREEILLDSETLDYVVRAHGNAGWALIMLAKIPESLAELRAAVDLDPSQDWIRSNLAISHLIDGDFEAGRTIYFDLLEKSSDPIAFVRELSEEFEFLRSTGIRNENLTRIESDLKAQIENQR